MATCGESGACLVSLERGQAGGDRCCPLRSGRSWPGCGPTVTNSQNSNPGRLLVLLRPMLE